MLKLKQVLVDIISSIKDIKILLTFFGVTGVSVVNFSSEALNFFYTNIHLFSLFSLFLMLIYIENTKQTMVKVQQAQNTKLLEVETNQRIRDLKARVDSAYKEYGNNKIVDEWVIKGLLELKDELDELNVNSYTQGKLESMIRNIEY